ncbi:MAG: ATP-dependent DNA helicase, partial [Sphaerochaetaceae bacterium]|nr:ATP-dependent DNA helicase [Sphaerochaetaceae bacterium]
PLSIAEMMQSYVYSSLRTVICTSATLDLKDDFKYWGSRVGLPCPNKKILTMKIDSSFNYKDNLLLLTALDSPEYDDKSPENYVSYIKEMVYSSIISSNGGTLVLFTSYKMMKDVYNALSDKLQKNNINALIQGSMDRFRILNIFKEDENSTLFATSSFWQGIDAPGNTLRLVIIVKLPFPSPGEPILGARLEEIDSRGESGFAKMLLPEAIMRLKQGFGRLIRKNTDKGIVLILDSRVVKKSYGGYMLSVLPECYQLITESKNICDKIENFLY